MELFFLVSREFLGFVAGARLVQPRRGRPRRQDGFILFGFPIRFRGFGAGAGLVWPRLGCPRRRDEIILSGFP